MGITGGTDTMGCWTVGHNLAGYMPESDVWAYATWQDAADQYREMATRYADEDDEWALDDDERPAANMREEVDASLASAPLVPGEPYGLLVDDNRGRTISLWLDWSDEDPPEEDGWLA